jgi:hypothetical protein
MVREVVGPSPFNPDALQYRTYRLDTGARLPEILGGSCSLDTLCAWAKREATADEVHRIRHPLKWDPQAVQWGERAVPGLHLSRSLLCQWADAAGLITLDQASVTCERCRTMLSERWVRSTRRTSSTPGG